MTVLASVLAIVIGIAESCQTNSVRVGTAYCESIRQSGNIPVVIPRQSSPQAYDEVLSRVDLLLLPGGEDVAPERYRAERERGLGKVNEERDQFEFDILSAAVRRRLPIFGICRGVQILNVFFGGTLHQDLPTFYGKKSPVFHGTGKDVVKAFAEHRHEVKLDPASRLAKVLGKTEIGVNSLHHQAVKDLAPGFRVAARSSDGSVEAIESDSYPAAGVQFHPEGLVYYGGDLEYLKVFRNLPALTGATGTKGR